MTTTLLTQSNQQSPSSLLRNNDAATSLLRPNAQNGSSAEAAGSFDSVLREQTQPADVERTEAAIVGGNEDDASVSSEADESSEPTSQDQTGDDGERADSDAERRSLQAEQASDPDQDEASSTERNTSGANSTESDADAVVRTDSATKQADVASPRSERGEAQIVAEDADVRELIALRGKGAAKLRLDSIRVELTHAAEVDLASKYAAELTSRTDPSAARREMMSAVSDAGLTDASSPKQAQIVGPPTAATTGSTFTGQPRMAQQQANGSSLPTVVPPSPEAAAASAAAAATPHANGNAALVASSATSPDLAGRTIRGLEAAARVPSVSGVKSAQQNGASQGAIKAVASVGRTQAKSSAKQPNTTPTRSPASPSPAEREESISNLQRGLGRLIRTGGGQMTLKLTPQSLGEVTVRLEMAEGTASARFEATNEVARALLNGGMKELRSALEARGVKVEQLSVEIVARQESAEPNSSQSAERGSRSAADRGDGSPTGSQERGSQDANTQDGGRRSPEQDGRHGVAQPSNHRDDPAWNAEESDPEQAQLLEDAEASDELDLHLDTIA